MSRIVPFLILAAGAVGLYFLWSKIFGGPPPKTAGEVASDQIAAARADCLSKGGTYQQVGGVGGIADSTGVLTTGNFGCRLPDLPPDKVVPGAYGNCPDRLSCAGAPSPSAAAVPSHPPYVPTPPAAKPGGQTGLLLFTPGRSVSPGTGPLGR